MEISLKDKNKFLYLLPFKDKKFFKIGISSNSDSRISLHNKKFNIDLENSIIYTAQKQSILNIIEREILIIFPQCEHPYNGFESGTEIREIKYLADSIKIIDSKPDVLGLKAHKYNEIFKKLPKADLKKKETDNKPSANSNRKAIQKEREFEELEYKMAFLEVLRTNKRLFKGYSFDRYDYLELNFENSFPYNNIKMRLINCSSMEANYEKLTLRFRYTFESDKENLDTFDIDRSQFLNKVCSTLEIAPTIEDREYARKIERDRVASISDYFDLCYNTNTPIACSDMMSGQTVKIEPSLFFKNVLFVQNEGWGFYWLHYIDGTKKRIFYDNGNDLVKGYSRSGYCYNSIEEKNREFKKIFKRNTLLQNRFLVMSKEVWFYFWYLMKGKFDILFTAGSDYTEASPFYELDYTELGKPYTLNQIQEQVKYTYPIKRQNNISTIDYSL